MIVLPIFSARAQSNASVEINDNFYSPADIHVVEGDTVTWTDLGGAHSVTADDGLSFDSSPACIAGLQCMATGDTFSHQFTVTGTFAYHCRVHGAAMAGTVIVEPVVTTTTTTSSTTSTTIASTTTSSDASAPPGSDQPTAVTQSPLPSLPSTGKSVALPRALVRTNHADDLRPWALVAVAIAAITTIAGIVLVRTGRVPFG